jgi:tRNA modification GTPase
VHKSREKIGTADLVVYLYDVNTLFREELITDIEKLNIDSQKLLVAGNKADLAPKPPKGLLTAISDLRSEDMMEASDIFISAKNKEGIAKLKQAFVDKVIDKTLASQNTIIANIRHYEALKNAYRSLDEVLAGIDTMITTDLIAFELRQALEYLGEISGEVTNDEILGNIFSKFCIGK